jgi:hypothetical protein
MSPPRHIARGYQPVFDDDADSNALQFFIFELALLERLPTLARLMANSVAAFAQHAAAMHDQIAVSGVGAMRQIESWKDRQKWRVENERAERVRHFGLFVRRREG